MKKIPFLSLRQIKATGWFLIVLGLFCFGWGAVASPAAEELKDTFRSQINDLQQQIDTFRDEIGDLQKQNKTLKQEIALLDSKIKTAELEVKKTALSIQQTEVSLVEKNTALDQAELKINREREILAEYLRTINESDEEGLLEVILSNSRLSDIFDRVNALHEVQQSVNESIRAIKEMKVVLENDKTALEDRREELNQLKVLQEIQRRSVISQQGERKNLLAQTKGQESNYQALMRKAKADVEAIKKNLYLLEGVGVALPLEQAFFQARLASQLTGVRPAFLLAVLKKESSWGEKVGTGIWRTDMNKRDHAAFLEICEKLGLDPDKTPVSRKPSYGWGGAMGPAQFLPAVWLSYESQIAKLTGHNPPDPWDIGDAFVAAAIKLAQAGASSQDEKAEWKAAQIYFAGKRWNSPTYYFYGDQVMEMAAVIQEQLNIITK